MEAWMERCIAAHECGHALVALMCGVPFATVDIVEEDDTYSGHTCFVESRASVADQLLIDCGGWAGVRLYHPTPGCFGRDAKQMGCQSDCDSAYDNIKQSYKRPWMDDKLIKHEINYWYRQVWRKMQKYSCVHTALFEALVQKTTLTSAECMTIYEGSNQ